MSRSAYRAAVRETWRHSDLADAKNDPAGLIRYATLAASSHNTQPWTFALARRHVSIAPDLSRRCPAVDPDDHHLHASLGCATENLLLAAEAAGMRGHASFDESTGRVEVALEDAPASRSALFEAIPERQCSRCEYDGSSLSRDELAALETAAQGAGASLLLLTDNRSRTTIADFVAAGNERQFADGAWSRELGQWIRFNAREALAAGDGLYGPVMGSPDVPRWLGQLVMRFAFSAEAQSRKDRAHIMSTPAIAVISSDVSDRAHWITAGRCYQRIALEAAALNLRTAFVNQPVEVADLRAQLQTALGLGSRRADLILRIGRGARMPRSLRRPLGEVVRP